jgi:hypothetical protein
MDTVWLEKNVWKLEDWLTDCSEFGNFVITFIDIINKMLIIVHIVLVVFVSHLSSYSLKWKFSRTKVISHRMRQTLFWHFPSCWILFKLVNYFTVWCWRFLFQDRLKKNRSPSLSFLCLPAPTPSKSVNNRKTVKTVMTLTWYRHF